MTDREVYFETQSSGVSHTGNFSIDDLTTTTFESKEAGCQILVQLVQNERFITYEEAARLKSFLVKSDLPETDEDAKKAKSARLKKAQEVISAKYPDPAILIVDIPSGRTLDEVLDKLMNDD